MLGGGAAAAGRLIRTGPGSFPLPWNLSHSANSPHIPIPLLNSIRVADMLLLSQTSVWVSRSAVEL